MLSTLLSCQCCSPEPAERPQVIHSTTEEHSALPVLLNPKSKELTKIKPEALLSSADPTRMNEVLADGPSLLLEEPTFSVTQPTATQDLVKKADVAQANSSAEKLQKALPEPEAETEETAHEEAAPAANDHDQLLTDTQRERAPQTEQEEERSENAERIVAEFSKRAASSIPCVYFNEKSGKRMSATYKISSDLTEFTIEADNRGVFSRFSLTIPLTKIRDVDHYEGTWMLLKPKVTQTLTNYETSRFLMIFYEDKKGEMARVCLIEDSVESRARFSTGLKMLASSMQK